MQQGIAICARVSAPAAQPIVVLAFKHGIGKDREYVLAWPCPFCNAVEHRHPAVGLQVSACGQGIYLVRSNGGRISSSHSGGGAHLRRV
jgi:hypothetical protein